VLHRVPRIALPLAALSGAMMFTATAVTPLVPGKFRSPFGDYLLPLAATGSEGRLPGLATSVSVNRVGIYEYTWGRAFRSSSTAGDWNAFNLGEFVFPHSRASLLPWLVIVGLGCAAVIHTARGPAPGEDHSQAAEESAGSTS
jgi:hypothetical protein